MQGLFFFGLTSYPARRVLTAPSGRLKRTRLPGSAQGSPGRTKLMWPKAVSAFIRSTTANVYSRVPTTGASRWTVTATASTLAASLPVASSSAGSALTTSVTPWVLWSPGTNKPWTLALEPFVPLELPAVYRPGVFHTQKIKLFIKNCACPCTAENSIDIMQIVLLV